MHQVDAYFTFFWREEDPSPNILSRIKLIKNMTFSYGITVWLPDEPHSSNDQRHIRTLEDAQSIVVFITADYFKANGSAENSMEFHETGHTGDELEVDAAPHTLSTTVVMTEPGRAKSLRNARMREELEQIKASVEQRSKVLLVVLEPEMRDRNLWTALTQHLFCDADIIDMTGDLNNLGYLSGCMSRLCEAITKKVTTPVMRHPIKAISVNTPYIPLPRKIKNPGQRFSTATTKNPSRDEVGPSRSNDELLPLIFAELGGLGWIESSGWGSDQPLDTWHGLTWMDGNLVKINLYKNNLAGNHSTDILATVVSSEGLLLM
jgi:hypothetical protein